MRVNEVREQRKATVGEIAVSAVDYVLFGRSVNETCVFGLGWSEVVGTYDDFDAVVRTLKATNRS